MRLGQIKDGVEDRPLPPVQPVTLGGITIPVMRKLIPNQNAFANRTSGTGMVAVSLPRISCLEAEPVR